MKYVSSSNINPSLINIFSEAIFSGNTPPTSPVQGTGGGPSPSGVGFPQLGGGGGGGATAAGSGGSSSAGGAGGDGATTEITASPVAYAGGGGAVNMR